MKKETNLCMSCMTPITGNETTPLKDSKNSNNKDKNKGEPPCPHCGWQDNGVYLSSYLYPKTFLADRYIVGKLISYNGEAALYEGFDTLAEIRVTIKEYMPDALCGREKEVLPLTVNSGELVLYKTYLSEFIELNRSLQGLGLIPGIRRVIDVFSENATAYAVCEYDSGISFAAYLQNNGGTLPYEETKGLFRPMFTALSKINAAGIIHRGISPKTVYVMLNNNTPQLYITDFAITAARIIGSKINSEVFAGYAAPEQYNAFERHGDWTDVYGIAALLYNVLTGVIPQEATERLTDEQTVEPSLINRDIPRALSLAIMKGMELSAGNRVKSVGAFSEMLWGAQTPTPISDTIAFTSTASIIRPVEPAEPLEPIIDGISMEFDDQYESDEAVEDDVLELRRQRKEEQRKKKMIIALSVISGIIVLFALLIMLSLFGIIDLSSDKNKEDNPLPVSTNATEATAATTEPAATANPDGEYQVVNFVGKDFNQNWIDPGNATFNFLTFEFDYEYSDDPDKPYGRILSQSIKAGESVPKGQKITLKQSLGPEYVILPDYTESLYAGTTVNNLAYMFINAGIKRENIAYLDNPNPFYSQPDMVDSVSHEPNALIRITTNPNDETKKADIVCIYRAVPMEGEEPEPQPEPEPEPLPTVAPPPTNAPETTAPPETARPDTTTAPPDDD